MATAADPCQAARQQFKRPLTADEQLAAVKSLLQPGDLRIKVAGVDIDGVLRGKVLSREKFLSAVKAGGFGIGDFSYIQPIQIMLIENSAFCSVVFGWDLHDKTYEQVNFSRADNGFADIVARIDLGTYRRIPWHVFFLFILFGKQFIGSCSDLTWHAGRTTSRSSWWISIARRTWSRWSSAPGRC